ncbi:hypothetical protein [Reyranella sp.]|uniref:hypothetical protein n=1 Tax=Reyranella sp. TaxID=1929291 RepID=UPI003BAB9CA5
MGKAGADRNLHARLLTEGGESACERLRRNIEGPLLCLGDAYPRFGLSDSVTTRNRRRRQRQRNTLQGLPGPSPDNRHHTLSQRHGAATGSAAASQIGAWSINVRRRKSF